MLKFPDWLGMAGWLFLASFIGHFVVALTGQDQLGWRWLLVSFFTSITLGMAAALIGGILGLGPLPTIGAASVLGWIGTPGLTALFQTLVERIKGNKPPQGHDL